jgi:putative ABC transport system substrate-binding protein
VLPRKALPLDIRLRPITLWYAKKNKRVVEAALRRRDLWLGAAGVLFAAPRVTLAQTLGQKYRLVALFPFSRNAAQVSALASALAQAGFVDGQNLEWRGSEQLPGAALDMVKDPVDLILAGGDIAIRAAQQATTTIPILGITDDMVGSGLVAAMAHPSGNVTGISLLATELDGKRQELLIEILAGPQKIAALVDIGTTLPERLDAMARSRGVKLSFHRISRPEEIGAAMEAAKQSGGAGLNILASPILFAARRQIIERAARLGVPAIYQWPETAEEGGLVGYGPRIVQIFQDLVARQLIRLLRGARPADLPVEQPTKFELVINLKTAKALGLNVPQSLLTRADEVIE